MKVLIAEDDAFFRKFLQQLLSPEYELLTQRDGDAAWQVLRENKEPILAILDWVMPGMTGPEVCRMVRAHVPAATTYMLLVTARNSPEDILAGLRAGADDYITKPFQPEELRSRVRLGQRIVQLEKLRTMQIAAMENSRVREEQLQARLLALGENAPNGMIPDLIYTQPLPSLRTNTESSQGDNMPALVQVNNRKIL